MSHDGSALYGAPQPLNHLRVRRRPGAGGPPPPPGCGSRWKWTSPPPYLSCLAPESRGGREIYEAQQPLDLLRVRGEWALEGCRPSRPRPPLEEAASYPPYLSSRSTYHSDLLGYGSESRWQSTTFSNPSGPSSMAASITAISTASATDIITTSAIATALHFLFSELLIR